MTAKPDWWEEVVARVKRDCTPDECAALDRMGEDAALLAALAHQWRNTGAMGAHDGEKYVRGVVEAMRVADAAEDSRRALNRENRRLRAQRRRMLEKAAELRRQWQHAAAEALEAAAGALRETKPDPAERARATHTAFIQELRSRCAGDWLEGVIGDRIIARTAELVYGVTVKPHTPRTLRRR